MAHRCLPEKDLELKYTIYADIKREANQQRFVPMRRIVDPIFNSHFQANPDAELPNLRYSKRVGYRSIKRPKNPVDLKFILEELKKDFPEDFFVDEVPVDRKGRHLIFATKNLLKLLAKAKRLYLDGTFKIVKHPFKQLFTIHAFIRHGELVKQVPILYVFMSKRRRKDYEAVMVKVKALLELYTESAHLKIKEVVFGF